MERVELLDADDGGVGDVPVLAMVGEVEVDFAGAEDDASGVLGRRGVGDDFLESAVGELGDRRGAAGIAQHAFGVMRTSGLRILRSAWRRRTWKKLAGVEQWATWMLSSAQAWRKRSRRALECSGPLAVIAVRQEQSDGGSFAPFSFRTDDVLVDDDLRAVGEIAELRFPENEHVGEIERVAEIETEHGVFGKRAVIDAEMGPGPT